MSIELHHFFILSEKPDSLAAEVSAIGLVEGEPNSHPGQGTANRRFFLPGSTLEILYVRDAAEALRGRASRLRFLDRLSSPGASPFGLVVAASEAAPAAFPGWPYYPSYFDDELFFHVGENSEQLEEPLCICMPQGLAPPAIPPESNNSNWILTELRLGVPVKRPSTPLDAVSQCREISLQVDTPHRIELVFNGNRQGQTRALTPDFPLLIHW